MNALVKKEIRLLLPSCSVALLLAAVQGITKPYNSYVAFLLFLGLTIMALTTIGRETSLNTLSSLFAQPAERLQLWKSKLSVLAGAYLAVFVVWAAGFAFAYLRSYAEIRPDNDLRENSYILFVTVCLMATATFTGGLWTTLLLRQLAGAFWLTLLVPATLSAFLAIFLSGREAGDLVIPVLSVAIGLYSLAGFWFARWLFFRAQDVGWSGGVIRLPEWKFSLARAGAGAVRVRQPIWGLVKKELLLQQGVLTGAAGLLVLHAAVIGLRVAHPFRNESAGDVLTSLWWVLWLVLPALVGSIAVAEERKLGVMESQLCLPVSRRAQFAVKAGMTLCLGVFLGGVMPVLLESIGLGLGSPSAAFRSPTGPLNVTGLLWFLTGTTFVAAWLSLVSFFASSLAKNFLQAVGLGLVTFVVLGIFVPMGLTRLCGWTAESNPMLPMIIGFPVLAVAMIWLASRNFADFREGWFFWTRNVIGLLGACMFALFFSHAIYYRAWEALAPAEPAHGVAKLSRGAGPELRHEGYGNLLVRLPDGRVWFDYFADRSRYDPGLGARLARIVNPLPRSGGPEHFLAGSNWAQASARHVDERFPGTNHQTIYLNGYAETIGIQEDGTLWVSDTPAGKTWAADKLSRVGADADWQQFARSVNPTSVLLVKKDGTLWRWGTNHYDLRRWPQDWPGLKAFQPCRVGSDADWAGVYSIESTAVARKKDGTSWWVAGGDKAGRDQMIRTTNYDAIQARDFSDLSFGTFGSFVREDGTLWLFERWYDHASRHSNFAVFQLGRAADWMASAVTRNWLVAMKSDGTLWQYPRTIGYYSKESGSPPPERLGIHSDWVSLTSVPGGIVSLAADGSLWLWPNRDAFSGALLAPPKQPQFIANVFAGAN